MGGPPSAIIIANAVLQLVGVVKGRSHIRPLMPPAGLNQIEGGGSLLVKHTDKTMALETSSLYILCVSLFCPVHISSDLCCLLFSFQQKTHLQICYRSMDIQIDG